MNDFTKAQLEEILECVVANDNPADNHDKLISKIQSMIDNYRECDHENLDTNICYKCGWPILV